MNLRPNRDTQAATTHSALLFETREERTDAVFPYLKSGLEREERCLYITDTSTPAEIWSTFAEFGIDRNSVDQGQIVIESADELYLTDSRFDVDGTIRYLGELLEENQRAGFGGLRITSEMTWALKPDVSFDHVIAYESKLQRITDEFPCVALCQYDVRRFGPEALISVIHTHPELLYNGRVCSNTYYTPPEEFVGTEKPELEVQRMLDTAYELTRAREEVWRREQRLHVVNRVLRHNIRNDLNVILGHSELLRENANSETLVESADQIFQAGQSLYTISKEAKRIENSLRSGPDRRVTLSLSQIVHQMIEDFRREIPDSSIECRIDGELWVEGSEDLRFALQTLLETILQNTNSITITGDRPGGNSAPTELVLEGGKNTLSESEINSLIGGRETPLHHSRGIGLWIVNWVVESSGGELFCDTENGSTVLRIVLTSVEEPES